MAENSKIEWTDHTFNPWRGCTKVHEGCAHCYAERDAKRFPQIRGIWGDHGTRVVAANDMWKQPMKWNAEANGSGVRARVFCASLADVFEDWTGDIRTHEGMTVHEDPNSGAWYGDKLRIGQSVITMNQLRKRLFEVIDRTPMLDWLLLTKRPENIWKMWPVKSPYTGHLHDAATIHDNNREFWYRPNVWVGTSISLQPHADKQLPHLVRCRDLCAGLFVSAEPLLGEIKLQHDRLIDGVVRNWLGDRGIGWVIAGGESGPGARPCHTRWAASLRDQCKLAGVPFFWKQWGEWLPLSDYDFHRLGMPEGRFAEDCMLGSGKRGDQVTSEVCRAEQDLPMVFYRVGKKLSGNTVEDKQYLQFPNFEGVS